MMRHQLPVCSPLSPGAILAAALSRGGGADDPRAQLAALLRREYAADDVVLTGSGTQALQLALEAARHEAGKDAVVALPAFSCFDVASAAIGADCRVTFYDVDPATLSPDLASLERAFREGARVAVVAVLYGIPVPWEELETCAAPHGAVLVEDAAQGHGASWHGRRVGSLGRISVLSFGRGKGWTGGGGGALLLRRGAQVPERRLDLAGSAAEAKVLLSSALQWALGRPALYGLPRMVPGLGLGETVYHSPVPPREMPARAAALLLATRDLAEAEAARRRRRGGAMAERLDLCDGATPRLLPGAQPGYLRLPVRFPAGAGPLADVAAARRLGVGSTYPMTLDRLPEITDRIAFVAPHGYPGARELVARLVTYPTHSGVTGGDRRALESLLEKSGLSESPVRASAVVP